jgi:hypothetical protein
MTKRNVVLLGGCVGLVGPFVVIALMSFYGVWEIMKIGPTDLRVILWPFSVMLIGGWCSTIPGVLITIAAISYNCLLYVAIALAIRSVFAPTSGKTKGSER